MAEQDFQRLLDLITKTTSQIGRLEERINALQSQIKSGDLGTGQIRQLNEQLDKLMGTLTQRRATQLQLVNQKDIVEASRGFDTLAKTISTVEANLEQLRRERGQVGSTLSGRMSDDFKAIEESIKRQERALSSFQSRMRNQYSALGYRQTPEERDRPFEPVELESRLNPAVGASARIRNTGGQMIAQLRDDFVAGMEAEAKKQAYRAKFPLTSRIEAQPAGTQPNYVAGGFGSDQDLNADLRMAAGGAKAAYDEFVRKTFRERLEQVKKQLEREAAETRDTVTELRGLSFGYPAGYTPPGGGPPDFEDYNRQHQKYPPGVAPIASTVSREQQREAAEKEALDSVRKKLQTEKRYVSVLEQAIRQGFTLDDLKLARTKGPGGVEQYRFARRDSQGVRQELDLFNTPSGRTSPGISNQFRTFGQGVLRDIGELTKWSIALAAVYGPMRQLQELTQRMIENQTRLAEATVSVSSSFIDQSDIFNIAAEAAEFAGESVSGVIDAFTQAYRAAGGGADEVERLQSAQTLLNQSLILSKLSTLDEAQAIDTLSAALRQTTGDLTGGTEILDKWVKVTKIANVDLASLATGFAILGDAADAAQINTDQLNGVLAAIAETGVASGRELANVARAIVAGFQSDNARKALENIGVAFADSTGQARPFLEVMQELSELRASGVLDDTAFSRLTLALGGGTRRQAAYATFIENFERVGQVAKESAQANGEAQVALAKQLETVQTSLTRLGNAFDELAQTLGTEGGFLGIMAGSVDTMTSVVKVFENLTGALGKATPALAAFIATSLLLRSRGQGGISQALSGYGQSLTTLAPEHARLNQVTGVTPIGDRFRQGVGRNIFGTNALSGGIQGLATAAIPALLNLSNTDDRFRGTKAAADAAGGLIGGVVGALAGPQGAIIGSTIGVAISEAFVNSTIARSTDIFGYTQAPTLGEPGAGPSSSEDLDEALRQAEIKLYQSIGRGNESLGRLLTAGTEKAGQTLVDSINDAIENQDEKQLENILGRRQGGVDVNQVLLRTLGISPELINQAFEQRRQIDFSPANAAFERASPEAQREFREAESARLARGGVPGREDTTAFSQAVIQNNDKFSDLLDAIKENSRQQLSQDRIAGDLKGAEYGRRTEALGGFDVRAVQYYTALGNQVSRLTGDATDAAGAFEVLNNVIVFGSEDALPQLTSLSGEIQQIVNLLEDPILNADALEAFGGADIAATRLEDLRVTLANLVQDANQQALLGRVKVPDVQGDINKPLTQDELGIVEQRARRLQDDFYQGFLEIPDDMYDALKSSWEEWAQIVEDSGETFFRTVSEIDPQFFQQAMQQLLEENRLASQETDPFGIQQLDITSQQGSGLQGMIDHFTNYLSREFPQYEQNPEQIGVIFSDYVTAVLHGDNLAIKLALDSLNDKAQKQLDGQYNIPEGATFWVPLTAAYYRPQNQGGAGGLPSVDSAAVEGNTSATDRNTQAIDELNLALRNEARRGVPPQETREAYLRRVDPDNLAFQNEARRQVTPTAAANRYNLALTNEERRGEVPFRSEKVFPPPGVRPIAQELTQNTVLQSAIRGLIDQIRNFLLTTNTTGVGRGAGAGFAPQVGEGSVGSRTLSQTASTQIPQVNARLELAIDNNTQLIVDGRVLASVVSPYLAQEMVRLEAASGTVTRRYVI